MKPLLIVLLLAGVLAPPTRGEEAAALELEMNWLPPVPVLSAVPGRWSYRTTSLAAHSTNSLPRDVLTAYSGETILFSSRGSYDPDGGPIVQRAWYVAYDWAPNKTTFCRASDNYCLQTYNEAFTMVMPALPAGQDSLRIGMLLYVEDDEGQTREKHFVVEVRREGRRLYYARDMLGSVREVVDSHGRVVEVRDYDPWGLELPGRSRVEGVKTREGYTGHELDEETGMNYAGARYYDPAIGRWFVVDPLAAKYPGFSPYNYVLNNPIILVDPSGMCPEGYETGDRWNGSACWSGTEVTASRLDGWEGWGAEYRDNPDGSRSQVFYVDASSRGGQAFLYQHYRATDTGCEAVGNLSLSFAAQQVGMMACIHEGGADFARNFARIILESSADAASVIGIASGAGTAVGVGLLIARRGALKMAGRNAAVQFVTASSALSSQSSLTEAGLRLGAYHAGGSAERAGEAVMLAAAGRFLGSASVIGVRPSGVVGPSFRGRSGFVSNEYGTLRFSLGHSIGSIPTIYALW